MAAGLSSFGGLLLLLHSSSLDSGDDLTSFLITSLCEGKVYEQKDAMAMENVIANGVKSFIQDRAQEIL